VDEQDPVVREAFRDAIRARIGWAPTSPSTTASVDVEQAGYVRFTPETIEIWR
jgi:hypothetical protein